MSRQAFYALPELEQEDWLELDEIERNACRCGRTDGECSDPETDWYPWAEVCWPTATLEANKALLAKRMEDAPYHDGQFESWSKKRSTTHPFHYLDGVSIWVSRQEPGEDYSDFLGLLGRDESGVPVSPDDADESPA